MLSSSLQSPWGRKFSEDLFFEYFFIFFFQKKVKFLTEIHQACKVYFFWELNKIRYMLPLQQHFLKTNLLSFWIGGVHAISFYKKRCKILTSLVSWSFPDFIPFLFLISFILYSLCFLILFLRIRKTIHLLILFLKVSNIQYFW